MIDYIDIPVGGESPDSPALHDPEACNSLPLREIMGRIKSAPVRNARLIGGEPMCHPNFEEIVAALRINGFERIRVQTAGWGFQARKQIWRVIQVGVRLFEVRFYSSSAREHDRLAGKRGSFAAARSALRHIRRAGQKLIGGGPTFVEARIVALPENVNSIEGIIARVSRWEVNQLAVVPGCRPFPMRQGAQAVARGIERALDSGKWTYLDGWPACLFPGLELHLRELTRKLDCAPNHFNACQGCAYSNFCRGVPRGFDLTAQPVTQSSRSGRNWPEFHDRVIRQGMDSC